MTLAILVIVFMYLLTYKGEYDSCSRANSNRELMRHTLETFDAPIPERIKPLDCWKIPFPANGNDT
jgi:hypothetical protein